MITTALVFFTLAAAPVFAAPVSGLAGKPALRRLTNADTPSGNGGDIAGHVIEGTLNSAGTIAAQGLEDGTDQQIASEQLSAALQTTTAQSVVGAQPTGATTSGQRRELLNGLTDHLEARGPRGKSIFCGSGSDILGHAISGGLGAAGNIDAQGLEDGTAQQIADQQVSAIQAATAQPTVALQPQASTTTTPAQRRELLDGLIDYLEDRSPRGKPILGGSGGDILGPVISGGLGAIENIGAQGLEDGTAQQIANQQLSASQAAAAAQQTSAAAPPGQKRYLIDELD